MAKRKGAVIAACLAVAAIALWLTFFRTSEEERIREVMTRLAKAVAVKEGDTVFSRGARIKSEMKEIVADDVRVTVEELSVHSDGRERLADDATKAGLLYNSATVSFTNMKIAVEPGATIAKVDATAAVSALRGGQRQTDVRDVHVLLFKDGHWRITSMEVFRTGGGE